MANAPIALFAYKRADKLEKCIKALEKNQGVEETDLYIFADGAKGEKDGDEVRAVRCYIDNYQKESRFRNVFVEKKEKNVGLANSIIAGVTSVINQYGKVIVVEDDLITTPDFLNYMNGALDYYEEDLVYGSISAYTYPLKELENYEKDVYATKKGECWGWATWKNRWENVDWEVRDFPQYRRSYRKRRAFKKLETGLDRMLVNQMTGKIDSWAVRWCYHLFKTGQLTVYPKCSKTVNIGMDNSGTHCGNLDKRFERKTENQMEEYNFEKIGFDKKLAHSVAIFSDQTMYQKMNSICIKWFRIMKNKLRM